ncbi:3,4-dihydroxy-2-butanone-4-phosphate synthase [Acuticoccus sediminis]|uniref:3,4-dihydroxy-2-butanone 4-phosphate synthase n=1 Tax=Acuticoccus sediminis TaxID=2184697 RepID=A0A8B2NIX1_9HYPH|nr:3,4-dihydroxy-2-butanone-4-phosphate synthase [Acuticoccus sediminis]RAH98236.1 3,4-dihydroxy-2-butanone-4-phosphate synthase [Acuticoccus sediminis]
MAGRMAAALRAFERGELVVVTDDDDRENEGDLICAASLATPEKLAFMIRHTSGIICAPMTRDSARRLSLAPMVADNDAPLATAFTVSVDVKHGLTTGIAAEERCNTVRALANPNSGAGDFVRPGHIFPLIAREGGVLIRSGHTEAAIDLCLLTGVAPVGVLSELVNDDGTVMRGAAVGEFAEKHGLVQISLNDIIAWRQRHERLVERVIDELRPLPSGSARVVTYKTPFDPLQHLAIVIGDIRDGANVPVRLTREHVVDDVFGPAVPRAMVERFQAMGRGVLVYLRDGGVGVAASAAMADKDEAHASAQARVREWREIGLGAQILRDLGVSSIHLLASTDRRYVGLEGFGITISGTEPVSADG